MMMAGRLIFYYFFYFLNQLQNRLEDASTCRVKMEGKEA